MVDLAAAYASCASDARAHYENFPVASLLLPRHMRPHVAAVYAFARAAVLNRERAAAGEPEIRFGIGLTAGDVIYGNVGAPDRLDFTVVGPAVNRAARLEALTKELGKPLLMCAEFARCLGRPMRSLGAHRVKGIAQPLETFGLEEATRETPA